MPVLATPTVHLPEHVITQRETLDLAWRLHAGHPKIRLVTRMIEHAQVTKRHLIRPIEETLHHSGFEHRSTVFAAEAKKRVPPVVEQALAHADLAPRDIDAIVFISCTGFMMPSLTAWLINTMGFPSRTAQIPIAQLGCAAGGAAINRANDYCRAHPGSNALIICCEFCSLCYQPDDLDLGSLLSNGLFGDAVCAAVVRGDNNATGVLIDAQTSHVIPDTEEWISYAVKATGFHFRLNRGVPDTMRGFTPDITAFMRTQGRDITALDFYAVHTGGPRILEGLREHGGIPNDKLRHSWNALTDHGNVASVAVFDVLTRIAANPPGEGAVGMVAGFGPGVTMELALGRWTNGNIR
ncbi:1,3,6,8-tetrahydroxynaphthalene synthase [Amycolatopsis taiwanensis]|uniref:1,3,6,8-tetrahydroxynaphthalene synthase n=2 Tax=Amycolatopsis taiwanensis TaxID=342230 RepID=A0A9W6R5P7_9PSEU|nr:1,3,6,8-tetrahydroxynaphthalene synthase [Amycolatopsis taiwanensis]